MQTSIPIPQSYVMQVPAPKETPERDAFYAKLHAFRDEIGEPIQRLPTLGFKELDLCVLYKEVVKRNGIDSVIAKKQWKEVAEALQLPSSCTDSGFRLRLHYKKYLEAFERKFYTPPPRCEPSSKSKECKLPKDKDSTKKEAVEKSSSSVTSSASVVTDLAEENHSSGSSARSSAITASTAEATSKGLKPSSLSSRSVELRKSSAIVKKKKRSNPITSPKTIIRGDAKDSIKLTKAVNVVNTPNSTAEKENESTHTGQDTKVAAGPSVSQNMDSSSDKQSHQTKEQIAQPSAPSSISGEKKVESSQETQREKPAAAKTTLSASERAYGNLSVLEAAVNAVDLDRKIAKRKNRVDFSVLEDSTLKRYAKVYDVADNCKAKSKKELADQVSAHFSATPLDGGEQEALLRFIQAVRRV